MLEPRRIARNVLVRVEQGGAFANRALDAALSEAGALDPRDVALATELTYGTLRRQVLIDHVLAHFSKRKLSELEPETRALLRLGAHQLLHLRVPEHAALHETVELAKEVHRGRAVPYVNAVLRALARGKTNVFIPPASVDPAGHLSLTESFPRWIVESLLAERSFDETQALLSAHNRTAPLNLRVNRLQADRTQVEHALKAELDLDALPTRWSPAGLALDATAPARLLRPESGRWQAQDEGAQLVGYFAAPVPGTTVLDACAAPGGKSCHLAELMEDRGHLDALDVHPGRMRDIVDAAERLELSIVHAQLADATLPLTFQPPGGYDAILVDAPCTGLGTVRRHPELKTKRVPEDVSRLAELQARLLDRLAGALSPGGTLTYAVCTFTREEGPAQVERFLARHRDFARAPPPAGPVDFSALTDAKGDLVLDPHRHGTDGFYATRLRRRP